MGPLAPDASRLKAEACGWLGEGIEVSTRTFKLAAAAVASTASLLAFSACGGQNTPSSATSGAAGEEISGTVTIDGSSTVAPLSEAAADLFRDVQPNVNVTVATAGTGGGFKKFCAGETDISDASRPIKDE